MTDGIALAITDEEFNAFHGQPHELFKTYCRLLWRMDYATGLVGVAHPIGDQSLKHLEGLGLLVPRPDMGAHVYWLPKAEQGSGHASCH